MTPITKRMVLKAAKARGVKNSRPALARLIAAVAKAQTDWQTKLSKGRDANGISWEHAVRQDAKRQLAQWQKLWYPIASDPGLQAAVRPFQAVEQMLTYGAIERDPVGFAATLIRHLKQL